MLFDMHISLSTYNFCLFCVYYTEYGIVLNILESLIMYYCYYMCILFTFFVKPVSQTVSRGECERILSASFFQ